MIYMYMLQLTIQFDNLLKLNTLLLQKHKLSHLFAWVSDKELLSRLIIVCKLAYRNKPNIWTNM